MVSVRAVLATAVALSALCLAVSPAASAAAADHVPHQLVVKYRLGTSGAEREQIRQAAGVRSAGTIDGRTQAVEVLGAQTTEVAAAKLESDPHVVHALPNYRAVATGFIPNDPGRGGPGDWTKLQWNFDGPWGVDAPDAW